MRHSFIILLILLSFESVAQRFSGNHLGGYSGVYGIQDNPATFVNKKPKWDINVLGTGIHLYNQYGYIKDQSLLSLMGSKGIVDANDSIPSNFDPNTQALFYAKPYSSPIDALLFNASVNLPGAVFKIGDFSFGAFANMRAHMDNQDLPILLNRSKIKDLQNLNAYTFNPTTTNAMLWGELGFNFGYRHELDNGNFLGLGVNAKYLVGYESAFFHLNSDYDVLKTGDTFLSNAVNADMGFASGASTKSNDYEFGARGTGFGLDLGAEYLIPNKDENSASIHYMKFGIAIKDLGGVNFSNNTETHKFVTNQRFAIESNITNQKANNYTVVKRLSQRIFNDSFASKTSSSYTMYLPTSINLHWDYNFRPDFYINAFLSRGVSSLKTQLTAPSVLMVGARYEKRWFEGGMNMNLVNDKWFGVGAYLRLGVLTIGSDHINTIFFAQPEFVGTDVYMSLKIMPFGLEGEKEKAADRFYNGGSKRSRCYTYR